MPRETHPFGLACRRLLVVGSLALITLPSISRAAEPSAAAATVPAAMTSAVSRDELARVVAALGDAPRVAGTAGARRAAALIEELMVSWGLEVEISEYDVWLPHAVEVSVTQLDGTPRVMTVAADPAGHDAHHDGNYPVAAGYSAAGDVTAPIVYANYGRRADFAALSNGGIDVAGKVALIRYGEIFRGDKVRNAEDAGAAAVILYSDPADDGYVRGSVYPNGPFRPPEGVQRGSIKIGAPGDPASPGRAASVSGPRVAPTSGLPGVPVVALGYADAEQLLAKSGGAAVPASWHGGLPMTYRVGGAGPLVRVRVVLDENPWRRIRNVVGRLRGVESPEEFVMLGAHYDSWTDGVMDNVSGTAAMLEAARVMAMQARQGRRPARSVLFAAWDAEEWGLIGSTEWVEEHAERVRDFAVAYINLDGVAGGPYFSALASPSLRALLYEGTAAVGDPVLPGASVRAGWQHRGSTRIGLPGGGSDYAPFAAIAGVPVMGFGFSAASGVYHSVHDTVEYMERFGDPGYRQHRAVAELAAWMTWRLAEDPLPPFDYRPLAQDLVRALDGVARQLGRQGFDHKVPGFAAAWSEAGALAAAAAALHGAVSDADAADLPRAQLAAYARRLRRAQRQMLQVQQDSDWVRSSLVAPDPTDTYKALFLPGVVTPLREGDIPATVLGLQRLSERLGAVAGELRAAAGLLQLQRRSRAVAGR
jgi:N-acetylated-alpha-linked acidic dipeptidase